MSFDTKKAEIARAVVEQEARAMAAEHAEVEKLREENVLLKNAIGTIRSFDVGCPTGCSCSVVTYQGRRRVNSWRTA